MFKKFGKLDKSEKGYVTTQDLNSVCDFKEDSIGQSVSENLASGFDDQIDFRNLIKNLSAFHNSDEDSKLKCKFPPPKIQSSFQPVGFKQRRVTCGGGTYQWFQVCDARPLE